MSKLAQDFVFLRGNSRSLSYNVCLVGCIPGICMDRLYVDYLGLVDILKLSRDPL